jgi:hypothetical protein
MTKGAVYEARQRDVLRAATKAARYWGEEYFPLDVLNDDEQDCLASAKAEAAAAATSGDFDGFTVRAEAYALLEGAVRALVNVRIILNTGKEGCEESAREMAVQMLADKDDTASGRGNDLRRARMDGRRQVLTNYLSYGELGLPRSL